MIWLLLVLLLFCSGTVSGSETALFSLNRQALEQFRRAGTGLGHRAHLLMQRPRQVLLTVLLSNTAVNVAIFSVSLLALDRVAHARPALVAAGGVGVLMAVVICGELLPKVVALNHARGLAPAAAGVISLLQAALAPLLWLLQTLLIEPLTRLASADHPLLDAVTTEELRLLVERSAAEGVIDSHENRMLQAVVELGEATVRAVMTPRVDVRWVDIDDPPAKVREAFALTTHRQLPVCQGDLDHVCGFLRGRDLYLNPHAPLADLLVPVAFVPEQSKLIQLLRYLRHREISRVIVVDEYGGTAGLVRLKDVLQHIVGDLSEHEDPEVDALPEQLDEQTYRLPGNLSARVWADSFAPGTLDRHVNTLGGLVLARLGRAPHPGDEVRIRNLILTVSVVRGRRVAEVILRRTGSTAEHSEGNV